MTSKPDSTAPPERRGGTLGAYRPLIVLILISIAAACALTSRDNRVLMDWMHYFMGIVLLVFAMLKLFQPSAFADGFQMYDLLAKRSRLYAHAYPYIELGLGLGYLSFAVPALTYWATIIVMSFGMVGVLIALARGLNINCACMGNVLNVPLSTVTLTEDIGMTVMAAAMLAVRAGH